MKSLPESIINARKTKRTRSCILPLLAATLLGAASVHATEVIPISLDETVRQADAIVMGTITSQHSRWGDSSKRWMFTDFTLSVDDTLYSANARTIQRSVLLTYWGGTLDGETQTISDMRLPVVGEHLLVMLRKGWQTEPGFTPVVGFNHGLFTLVTNSQDGRAMVLDFAGKNLSLTAQGQVTRDRSANAASSGNADLITFKQWLRANVASIKSRPSELPPMPDASDPRLISPFAKVPQIPDGSTTTMQTNNSGAVRVPHSPAGPSASDLPGEPISNLAPAGGGNEVASPIKMHSKYSTSHQAHLPIVINQFPSSFAPWSPEDQYQMSKWNYYDDVFRVYASPTGTYGWPNGVFDLAGWPSSADLQRVYGSPWGATTVGITFLRYDGNGWIVEADIALNPAFGFTLDDEWVYNGSSAQPFRYTLLHELGHMHGLEHDFTFLSVMNYLSPGNFRAFGLPYTDDAGGIRFEYPGNVVNRTDLGIYLYYCPGSTAVYESSFPSTVLAGDTLTVNNYHVENVGTVTIGTPTIEWYLTSARNYSSSYYYLGTSTYSSLAPFSYFYPDSVSRTFSVPASVAAGNYYLAAFIRNDDGAWQSSFPFYNNMAFSRSLITVTHLPPYNDQCYGAFTLANGVPLIEDTQDATSTGDPIPVCRSNFGKGVWFAFTPSNDGPVTINTCDSTFDTVLQVFTGSCGSMTPVVGGCDDDDGPSCESLRASVQFNGTAGTPYLILAGGYGGNGGTLSIVANSAPIHLGGCGINGAGEFHLDINGPPGASCIIQVSADLINWTNLGSYPIPANGSTTINDAAAVGQPRRFYRALMQ